MRAYLIARMAGGRPDFGDGAGEVLPCHGYALAGHIGQAWGCYLVAGTAAELTALNALPQVYAICTVGQLDGTIPAARRLRLNTWLNLRGFPTIPAGVTYRTVVDTIFTRVNERFQLAALDVADAG